MSLANYEYTVTERFLRYIQFDTQSNDDSKTYPSTTGQWSLLKLLEQELQLLGLAQVNLDKYGYLTATLPSNLDYKSPTLAFFAHIDTSGSVSGANIKTIIHKNYQGQTIILPADNSQKISVENTPELAHMFGQDLITTDGSTLLGGDDKCGVAEIMDALNYLITHPEIKHGEIKVCFNPDEEVGKGVEYFDVAHFGADVGYTLDGQGQGILELENFNAGEMIIKFVGKNYHPGYAKDRMINSLKIASEFVHRLPKKQSPEMTENRQGYIHPMFVNGNEELSVVKLILRDFTLAGLKKRKILVENLANKLATKFGGKANCEYKEQYFNMKSTMNKNPKIVQKTLDAYRALGIEPKIQAIRGGTDGVMLAQKGLPCPNLSSGQHNIHSKTEFTSVQEQQLAVNLILEIIQQWVKPHKNKPFSRPKPNT